MLEVVVKIGEYLYIYIYIHLLVYYTQDLNSVIIVNIFYEIHLTIFYVKEQKNHRTLTVLFFFFF
jgi:hypothetical protein